MDDNTPYVKHEQLADGIDLYLGDCRQIIDSLKFDAIITDPPYGISYCKDFRNISRDSTNPLQFRAPKNSTIIIGDCESFDPAFLLRYGHKIPTAMFGVNHYYDKLPPPCKNSTWIAWDKSCGGGSKNNFADCEFIWINRISKRNVYHHKWQGAVREGEQAPVLQARLHVSEKPIALLDYLIRELRVGMGKTVIDPFMGSGTTAIPCIRSGINFIGIEIDEKYYEVAKTRIQKELEMLD